MLRIGITGHRLLAHETEIRRDIFLALQYFLQRDKELIALSALATGADTIFAEEALRLQIPLHVVLPFSKDEYRKDFKPEEWDVMESILLRSTSMIQLSGPDLMNKDTRDQAYWAVGKHVVDASDIVLAVWDGELAQGKGGTADVVQFAEEQKKELHIIHAERGLASLSNMEVQGLEEQFNLLDNAAIFYKTKRFEPAWITGIITGLIGVFSLAYSSAFNPSALTAYLLSSAEFVLFFVSFLTLAVIARKWKLKFLENRRGAECLRSVLWYKKAGIPLPPESEIREMNSESILQLLRKVSAGITSIKRFRHAQRLTWSLAHDQVLYHSEVRIKRFEKRLQRVENILKVLKFSFFTVTILNFIFETLLYFNLYNNGERNNFTALLIFLGFIIPALFAALEGVKFFSDWKRDIGISRQLILDLGLIKEELLQAGSDTELLHHSKKLRDILELENIDWTIRFREKEEHSGI